jgi:hypothetical protein
MAALDCDKFAAASGTSPAMQLKNLHAPLFVSLTLIKREIKSYPIK